MLVARSLAILGLLLVAAAPARAVTETDFCASGADPCEFNGTALAVDRNTALDFGARTLIIGSAKKIDVTGGVSLTIHAGAFIMRPGSRIGNGTVATGATVSVTTDNDISMEATGETRSRIEVPGTVVGGNILLTAGGDISLDGAIRANGAAADAAGGVLDLEAGGQVTLDGITNLSGGLAESGGQLSIGADGPVVISGAVDASGGFGLGSIDLSSGGSLSTTAPLDVRGTVGGSLGGDVLIDVVGSISIGANIFAQAFGSVTGGGGSGGEVTMTAGSSIVIADVIDLSGGSPEGDGGFADFGAGVDIVQKGSVLAVGGGTGGSGGVVSYEAGRLLSLQALNDVGGSSVGGDLSGTGRGTVEVKGEVDANGVGIGGVGGTIAFDGLVPGVPQVSGNIVISNALRTNGDAASVAGGGSITLKACDLTVDSAGLLDNAGDKSANLLQASGLMTIAGRVQALPQGTNTLEFRDANKTPVIPDPMDVDPAATPTRNPNLPGCLPPVPPTCGNGDIEGVEGCDDGNLTSCDGCSGGANGMTCHADGCCQVEACGNGVKECAEECDDGNVIDGDGCDSNCKPTGCGNGRVTGTEECDDGNTVSGDGCSATCEIEPPPGCGNGMADPGEECDDGNNVNCDGCSKICVKEGCGNGVKECGEACDDGGTAACDGECSADCTRPAAVCGDSITECGEECDAGGSNGAPGSACSGFCRTCSIGSGADCPCGTDFDCAPTGRCGGVACLSGACSSVPIPKCNDGNDCNGVETCVDGACTVPTPPVCVDNDPCTDDTCNPVGGCPHVRLTGFPGVTCRIDFIKSSADGAAIGDLQTKIRAKILKLADAVRSRLDDAATETKVKRQKKLLKVADAQLRKLKALIAKGAKKHQVSETLRALLNEQVDGARSAASAIRAGLSG